MTSIINSVTNCLLSDVRIAAHIGNVKFEEQREGQPDELR